MVYGDDGLAILKNVGGQISKKIIKKTITIFVSQKRLVIIECNLEVVNYLDVKFNLNYGSYQPYSKPNDEAQ